MLLRAVFPERIHKINTVDKTVHSSFQEIFLAYVYNKIVVPGIRALPPL
jgi:hypothetical protein